MSAIYLIPLIVGIIIILLELNHRFKPTSPLRLRSLNWDISYKGDNYEIEGWIEITNPHRKMEVMVPKLKVNPVLLGRGDLNQIQPKIVITPIHPDEEVRDDNYWAAYIVKNQRKTTIKINLSFPENKSSGIIVENIWLEVDWINYGPFGRLILQDGFVIPLKNPKILDPLSTYFIQGKDFKILPIKTHLLGTLDNPIKVLKKYTSSIIQSGDVLTIGETPLAVMQNRYRLPCNIKPELLAMILCRSFKSTSSLATAYGLQSLIDLVGPTRVLLAWIIGASLKIIGIKGGFYRFAGEQARLIDDITGTTPPYDQTIVLGPLHPSQLCEEAARDLGVSIAIVDVNDLGRVKVVASSIGCDQSLIKRALCSNPAGNANQRTPLVLIRPN